MSLIPFIRQLFNLAKPNKALVSLLAGLVLIDVLAMVPGPFLFAWLIDNMQADLQTKHVVWFLAAILGLELISTTTRVLRVRFNRRFSMESANRLRDTFVEHLLHLPYSFFLLHQSGGQANQYLNDIDDIDESVSGLVELGLRNLVILVVLFTTMLLGTLSLVW